MEDATSDADPNDVTKLAEYLFLIEQMGWRKELKLFQERECYRERIGSSQRGIATHTRHDVGFQSKHWYELTKEERTKVLKYLMYLKKKRDGRTKGRGCADG